MTKRLRTISESPKTTTALVRIVAGLVVVLVFSNAWLVINDSKQSGDIKNQQTTLETQGRLFFEQNVRARFDDCTRSEQVRKGLREQVAESATTLPILLKLVPSLNNPDILERAKVSQARRLRAFAAVPGGCETYALKSVPVKQRAAYAHLVD